jgi:hypothetical protein
MGYIVEVVVLYVVYEESGVGLLGKKGKLNHTLYFTLSQHHIHRLPFFKPNSYLHA